MEQLEERCCMRKAWVAFVGAGCVFAAVAACVGGPGPLPEQGGEQPSQGGGIQGAGTAGQGTASKSGGTAESSTKTIKASEFDRSCTADGDCVAVFEGLVCTQCKCPNAAIAKKDQAKLGSALVDRSAGCPATDDVECAPCPPASVRCDPDTKQCALVKPDAG
jgi:hypothetical protein